MIKRFFFFLLAFIAISNARAQQPGEALANKASRLRVSLLTCGPGYNEVYEVFGHTGIRVVDSNAEGVQSDVVFNYGMFAFDDNFEIKFMRGKLLYYVGVNTIGDFMDEYVSAGRKVEEQVLNLDDKDKAQIFSMLKENSLPQNMYYKYDFFFDNCATRVRDIFQKALGGGFVYGNTLPNGYKRTFRDIINQYFFCKHWERVGVNILLGSKIDKVMSNSDIMFLPDFLRDGIGGAKLNGRVVATPPQMLLGERGHTVAGTNQPLLLTLSLMLLTIAGLFIKKLRLLGRAMSALLLFVSGLLGCLILVMWFATDHQGCSNNWNVLWALPLNIFIAFANPRGKGKYSVIAMVLIIVSLLLHVLRVQGIVVELMPLLFSLLLIHGANYRNSKNIRVLPEAGNKIEVDNEEVDNKIIDQDVLS